MDVTGRSYIIVLFFCITMGMTAQIEEQTITRDSVFSALKLEANIAEEAETEKKFFQRLLQLIKFKENRDKAEQKRVEALIDTLIKAQELKINRIALDAILTDFEQKLVRDSLALDTIDAQIQTAIRKAAINAKKRDDSLRKRTSKEKIKNIKDRLTTLMLDATIDPNEEDREVLKEIRERIKTLRDIRAPYRDDDTYVEQVPISDEQGDGTMKFKRTTRPAFEVIGWYNKWDKRQYRNFDYKNLTALNLYGYDISPDKKDDNLKQMRNFTKENGVIDYAQARGTDVLLTVYSKKPAKIQELLRQQETQDVLITDLKKLIEAHNLKGINIYFEDVAIRDNLRFVSFVKRLSNALNTQAQPISLYITIPAIYKSESVKDISAYAFEDLNTIVDYYILATDRMTEMVNPRPQGPSPLYETANTSGSIQATVDYYTNGKIAAKKLIVSVSYLGLEWEVHDFTGNGKERTSAIHVELGIIQELYENNNDYSYALVQGYDKDQATSFYDIVETDNATRAETYKQLWYESYRSLYEKYKWIRENELGGVSIRGLSYADTKDTELWYAMEAALTQVDTIDKVTTYTSQKLKKSKWEVFKNDWSWSDEANLEYYVGTQKDSLRSCTNDDVTAVAKADSLPSIAAMEIEDRYLATQNYIRHKDRKYITGTDIKKPQILENFDQCRCLMSRWQLYSKLLLWLAVLSTVLIILLEAVIYHLDRFIKGQSWRLFLRVLQVFFFFVGLPALISGIWIAPWNPLVGTNSDGTSKTDIVIFGSVIFGLLLGLFIRKWMMAKRQYRY